jgi:hypothetical protein
MKIKIKFEPLFLLIIFYQTNFIKSETSIIEISNPYEKINTFYTFFYSESVKKTDYRDDESFSFAGKLCSANNTDQVINDCFLKYENFNYFWVSIYP